MQEEAYQVLGLGQEADGRTIEAAYWRRARELAEQRRTSPLAAEELERVNWAYQTLSDRILTRPPTRLSRRRPSWLRRFALASAVALAVGGSLGAGLSYRHEIHDGALRGFDKAQGGWDETIAWLQSVGVEPTPEPPGSTPQ